MNLTKLTAAQFNKIAGLLEKKEALQAKINDIDQELSGFEVAGAAPGPAASPAPSPGPTGTSGRGKYKRSAAVRAKMAASQRARWAKPAGAATAGPVAKVARVSTPVPGLKAGKAGKSQRGAVKEAIISVIKGAGKAGITVKDVAETLGIKYANASVWFGSTGKKVREIKRVARGTYAWVG